MSFKKSRNTSTKSTLVAQIVFVVIITVGIVFFERFFSDRLSLNNGDIRGEATLLIDFDNMRRMFEGEVVGKMTVLDALNASVVAGKIKFRYIVNSDNDTTVTEINDHTTSKDTQFNFYLNSRKMDSSELNKTNIKPGDKITIKLE